MQKHDIAQTIADGVRYLAAAQGKDGAFPGMTSADVQFADARTRRSIFPTCLVLSALRTVPGRETKRVSRAAAHYIKTQRGEQWSFNYWERGSDDASGQPYPDDLDDTSCALAGLCGYDRRIVNGAVLADLVAMLAAAERDEGGPYRTWLVPPGTKGWDDVDLAVNANIGRMLGLQGVRLRSIDALVGDAIDRKRYRSPYYASEYAPIYFIAQWYRGRRKKEITEYLLSKRGKDGSWKGNPLDTALAVSSLIAMGRPRRDLVTSVRYLVGAGERVRRPYPFVIERVEGSRREYMGSAALTTALVVEALARYGAATALKKGNVGVAGKADAAKKKADAICDHMMAAVDARLRLAGKELYKRSRPVVGRVTAGGKGRQVALLPDLFRSALGGNSDDIADDLVAELGAINMFGWIAYTVYDDVYDAQADAGTVPVANVCLREVAARLGSLPLAPDARAMIREVLDGIDRANAWEMAHCRAKIGAGTVSLPHRLPVYGDLANLADRSFGHALGPMVILASMGHAANGAEMRALTAFFRDYIIARQLNDDAHDWEEDLWQGNMSAVVAMVLADAGVRGGSVISADDRERLRSVFWNRTVAAVCKEIIHRTASARRALGTMRTIEHGGLLEDLLHPIEAAARRTLEEQAEMKQLVRAYRKQ